MNILETLYKELDELKDKLDIAMVMESDTTELKTRIKIKKEEINKVKSESETKSYFYEDIVKKLKYEALTMSENLNKKNKNDDYRAYIDLVKVLRETLNLISIYDWQIRYGCGYKDGGKKVEIWEQNHDGQIRNRKVWEVSGIVFDEADITLSNN